MPLPRAPDRLPGEMTEALGHAIAGFGFLEEALKRAIFSLTRQDIGLDDEAALERWLRRIEDIADDSLGTLIDSFVSTARRAGVADHARPGADLSRMRVMRNLLCHASWRPGTRAGRWHPTFINTRGERHPGELSPADLSDVQAETLRIARRIVSIMQATGIEGEWAGQDEP